MSLLLDALKKAALDKQKSAAAAETPATPEPAAVKPDEQELTLDLEPLSARPESELNAELDATPLSIDAHDANTQKAVTPRTATEELPELATDIKPPPSEIRHEARHFTKPAQSIKTPVATPVPPPRADTPGPQPAQHATAASLATASLAAQQAAAKQRDALDLMINKSRQSNANARTVQIYGLVIFSVLLLLLGGIYFYVSSEPTPPIADVPAPEETAAPVADITPTPAPQQSVAVTQPVPAHASSSIPKPRRAASTAPAQQKPAAEPLQFTRTVREDPIESLLNQAYEKFQAGDYDGANQLYLLVLQREANSRDGLLGTAAVAMKQQRPDYARKQYQKLLMLDPKDSLARAGVSFIDMDVRDESQLKFILREQPNAAHLHFALGALYASQSRWAEAQQAYFNAYTADNNNADYAYNLAVSLDQLGQYKAARGYYQKALQLADSQRAGFVAADLQTRIDQISNLPEGSK